MVRVLSQHWFEPCIYIYIYIYIYIIIVFDIPLTRGHPSNIIKPDFPFPKGGLIRRGPLYCSVYIYYIGIRYVYKTKRGCRTRPSFHASDNPDINLRAGPVGPLEG